MENLTASLPTDFVPIKGLHHWAFRCRDAEETRHFYEDILGLPLAHIIQSDTVPSTGAYCPYVHIFFRMDDGAYVAFFDLGDDLASDPSPNTEMWVNHLALRVDSVERLHDAKRKLEAAGVEVLGVTDHGFIQSIYFFDPNGIRLELTLTVEDPAYMKSAMAKARPRLNDWTQKKQMRRASGALKASGQIIVRSHSDPAFR
jgi:catechol 2,3-dioxygenase-like lactoylglutathione lyase family enzyme